MSERLGGTALPSILPIFPLTGVLLLPRGRLPLPFLPSRHLPLPFLPCRRQPILFLSIRPPPFRLLPRR